MHLLKAFRAPVTLQQKRKNAKYLTKAHILKKFRFRFQEQSVALESGLGCRCQDKTDIFLALDKELL